MGANDPAALARRFQAGDEAAFAELYELYKTPALRSAFLITGNHFDSENVLQETFWKCYRNLPRLKDPAKFKPWFYRILTRTAWEYCQKRDRETPVAEVLPPDRQEPADLAAEQAEAAETRRELLAAIDKLPWPQKTAVILYYYNELSVEEIAKATGCLTGTVKSRLFNARRNLKKNLSRNLREQIGRRVDTNELQTQA